MNSIEIGSVAPQFTLFADGGKEVSLSDYRGKKVILYFYPKDNTPGCTTEAHDFDTAFDLLQENGYNVIGVSRDTVKKHENFKNKYGFRFTLLADVDEVACKAYDVLKEKVNYGRAYIGIDRSTFIINEEGIITHVYRSVKVPSHVQTILSDLGIAYGD